MTQLRALSRREGVPMAALVREAVTRLVQERTMDRTRQRARAAVGFVNDPALSGRDHDATLDDAFGP